MTERDEVQLSIDGAYIRVTGDPISGDVSIEILHDDAAHLSRSTAKLLVAVLLKFVEGIND